MYLKKKLQIWFAYWVLYIYLTDSIVEQIACLNYLYVWLLEAQIVVNGARSAMT